LVVDTHVFLRSLGDGSNGMFEKIKSKCDRIVFTKKILKEYASKAKSEGMSIEVFRRRLERFIDRFKRYRKEVFVGESRLRLIRRELVFPRGFDKYDKKFVEAASAFDEGCIITRDLKIHELGQPFSLDVLTPEDYIRDC
jgi:predicted nucleic acid-binding protein